MLLQSASLFSSYNEIQKEVWHMENDMSAFYMSVGYRIRSLRTEQNLTREEFAEMIDISSKYIYEIEKGKKNFSIGILFKICSALGVPSSVILDEKIGIDQLILTELVGRFTSEDKQYIKDTIISQICDNK